MKIFHSEKYLLKNSIAVFIIVFIGVTSAFLKSRSLHDSLILDEIYTVITSRAPFWTLIMGIRYDPAYPPLYYLITKYWIFIAGNSEVALRSLSIIFDGLSYILFAFITRKIFKKPLWISMCFWFASSHLLFTLSRYARAYSLILLLSLLTFFLFYYFLSKTRNFLYWGAATFVCCLIGIYTHYCFILFYLFCITTYSIQFQKNPFALKKIGIFSVLLGYFYLPWAWLFIRNQFWPNAAWQSFATHYGNRWNGLESWIETLSNGFLPYTLPDVYRYISAILFFCIIDIILLKTYLHIKNSCIKKSVLLFTLISMNSVLFTPIHNVFDLPRYCMYIIPMLIISFGIVADEIKSRLYAIVPITCIVMYSCISLLRFPYSSPNENWRNLAETMSKITLHNAVILFEPCPLGFAFDYYYRGTLPRYCFYQNPKKMYLTIWQPKETDTIYFITYRDATKEHVMEDTYGQFMSYYSKTTQSFGEITLITYQKNHPFSSNGRY